MRKNLLKWFSTHCSQICGPIRASVGPVLFTTILQEHVGLVADVLLAACQMNVKGGVLPTTAITTDHMTFADSHTVYRGVTYGRLRRADHAVFWSTDRDRFYRGRRAPLLCGCGAPTDRTVRVLDASMVVV